MGASRMLKVEQKPFEYIFERNQSTPPQSRRIDSRMDMGRWQAGRQGRNRECTVRFPFRSIFRGGRTERQGAGLCHEYR
ncbi:hypothetical protein ARTHRO9AX_160041 [Arthrobacter sp. 9AX]|nr:hypothetical protein ARTHRO9AX_160041 [Arthrobacter sp. 9AX]